MHTGRSILYLGLVMTLSVVILGAGIGFHHLAWAEVAAPGNESADNVSPGRQVNGPPGPGQKATVPGISPPTPTPGPAQVTPGPLPLPPGTPLPLASPIPARPLQCGLLTDFEQFGTWRRGDEPYGTFTQSTEQVYSGFYSGKLAYDFPTPGNDYVVFMRSIQMGGHGNAVTAWVYGDNSGHYLNCWIKDAMGEVWQFTFGQIRHLGWQQMSAPLDVVGAWPAGHVSGLENWVLDYPINFHALVLDDAPDTHMGSGAIYIDGLSCAKGPVMVGPPVASPALSSSSPCRVDLQAPPDGSHFGPANETVTLQWQMDRPLAANEYYFVNVEFPHGGTTWYDGTWRDPSRQLPDGTQDTHWTLRDYLCMPGFSDTGWYSWNVSVRVQAGPEKTMDDTVVCESGKRSFEWTGCYPTPTPTDVVPYP